MDEGLQRFADRINQNLPLSEKWFQSLWKKDLYDCYNSPFEGLIPDCINCKYKYIIEVDGCIHVDPKIKKADFKKDLKYRGLGYKVFRLIAYDWKGLVAIQDEVSAYILMKNKKKVILRKNYIP